jgi:hypothetical protein
MLAFLFGHRRTTGDHSLPRLTCLVLCCAAFMLLDPHGMYVRSAKAEHIPAHTPEWTDFNTHDPGIVFASGASTQAIVLLIANPADPALGRRCHFNGKVRTEELTPPFGAGLDDLVFEPISLAPGESLAIDIPPHNASAPGAQIVPSQIRVLIMAIEADDAVSDQCPLLVQALGYDTGSGATEVLIDRYTFGVEKTFAVSGHVRSPVPLGFVGGDTDQAARLILISENNSPLPVAHCDLTGKVIAQLAPRLADDPDDQTGSIENAWPIKWQGPSSQSVAIIDIPFDEFDPADRRVDALLSLRFDHPLPAACLKRINASLQILDQTTGATQAVIPADRVFFNYHHFDN